MDQGTVRPSLFADRKRSIAPEPVGTFRETHEVRQLE